MTVGMCTVQLSSGVSTMEIAVLEGEPGFRPTGEKTSWTCAIGSPGLGTIPPNYEVFAVLAAVYHSNKSRIG